ncbi:5'-methylthioadenosine/S-adenosylhomocysteine nucleosidase [Afipia sp. GAS231]|uniref:5'-methylthioadenosine/S-adenosylhomocysteine nucleosidase family protein n=1 Tax=Afipia sp. GAS231 TaxID=1882747 RepID=UPI00087C573B|nr:5'-methylthioadenosine/S-adenosylhomocysteine nucleosidase [Afipia sp. GAS231]SDP04586.1 Nucleoside phosphorylase [Afipia sp. GAS231]
MKSIDFAILTGLKEEIETLLAAIPDLKEVAGEQQSDVWYRGRIGSERGYGYSIVATLARDMGPVPATLLTQHIIARWNPAHIILLGIAGSFSKDIRLGDVIVSQQIFYYGPGKQTDKGIQYRPEGYPCSMVLVRQLQALTMDRKRMTSLRAEANRSARKKATKAPKTLKGKDLDAVRSHKPDTYFGTVASGELVVASQKKQKDLLKLHGKILGTEMEGAGVLHAAFFSGDDPVSAILVKGISDHADHLKAHEDEKKCWRTLATENSIRLVLSLLRSGRIKPLQTDEFSLDLTRSTLAELGNRINLSVAPGVAVLGFSRLVLPKGPLTRLAIEITPTSEDNRTLRIVTGVVEHLDLHGKLVATEIPADARKIEIENVGPSPVGIYLMLAGTAKHVHFLVHGPAERQEVGLVL